MAIRKRGRGEWIFSGQSTPAGWVCRRASRARGGSASRVLVRVREKRSRRAAACFCTKRGGLGRPTAAAAGCPPCGPPVPADPAGPKLFSLGCRGLVSIEFKLEMTGQQSVAGLRPATLQSLASSSHISPDLPCRRGRGGETTTRYNTASAAQFAPRGRGCTANTIRSRAMGSSRYLLASRRVMPQETRRPTSCRSLSKSSVSRGMSPGAFRIPDNCARCGDSNAK